MSYLVLARKYRPQTLEELIGQERIVTLLKGAISSKRVGSAYLFCGPRGVGKTSCARIFAKSLNCKDGPTLTPCGQCPACREITLSTSFDVIEVDGASNRGIDEIRTLRENVKFSPSYGKYKIYIVDEVHMLTTEAFNALLKTLEEPPEHVKFIFATTAPGKVPATILSRCQRFDFKRISLDQIIEALTVICEKEELKIDREALFAIAKSASGGLRDALSVLDQLASFGKKGIQLSDVSAMLGMVELELLFELADCLAQKDCAGALKIFDRIINEGKDIKQLVRDVIEHFRHLMVIKVGGKALGSLVDYPIATKELLLTQAEKFSLRELINTIETLVESQETSRIMDSLRIPIEVAFAKLTYAGSTKSVQPPLAQDVKHSSAVGAKTQPQAPLKAPPSAAPGSRPSPFNVLTNQKGQVDFSVGAEDAVAVNVTSNAASKEELLSPAVSVDVAAQSCELNLEDVRKNWDAATHAVSRAKMSVGTYLQEGVPYQVKGSTLTIAFSKDAQFHKESLEEKESLKLLNKIFSEKFQTPVYVDLKIIAERQPPQENEPFVKTTIETFHGKIVNKWNIE